MGKPLSFLASDGTRMSCLLICATTAAAVAKARATDGRPLRCASHFFCLCRAKKSCKRRLFHQPLSFRCYVEPCSSSRSEEEEW
ncbi:unnamed protein product [Sphagnum jensenii]